MRKTFQLFDKALSPVECDTIIEKCEKNMLRKAMVIDGASEKKISHVRAAKITFINDPQITETIKYFLEKANRDSFGFNVNFLPRGTQYTVYEKDCFYAWHQDVDWNSDKMSDRKLSIVVQLSDPSEYDGGDFEFGKKIGFPEGFKERGSVLVFPSYQIHRVSPVTKGTRKSLVNWYEGPRWR